MTELDRAAARIARQQHGAFHLCQLPEQLATRAAVRTRLATGRWHRATRQVVVVDGAADTWRQQLWIGHLEAGLDTLVSRRSVAALRGLPGFAQGPVDVLKREIREERVTRSHLHISSWIPPHHRASVDGLPTTTVARTLFDLAGISSPKRRRRGLPYLHPDRVARAFDDALVRGLTSYDEVAAVVGALGKRGRPGTVLMRRLLEERGDGHVVTESALEDLFLEVITARGLPRPERQRMLGGDDLVGRIDFVFVEERVVVECDGRRHHFGSVDSEADRWRDLELSAAGWVVVRVTWWRLVNEPDQFVERLRTLLERRSPVPR